jgi:hypothetical protein
MHRRMAAVSGEQVLYRARILLYSIRAREEKYGGRQAPQVANHCQAIFPRHSHDHHATEVRGLPVPKLRACGVILPHATDGVGDGEGEDEQQAISKARFSTSGSSSDLGANSGVPKSIRRFWHGLATIPEVVLAAEAACRGRGRCPRWTRRYVG